MRLIGLAVVLAVSLTLAPLAAQAQQAAKVPRVGFISAAPLPPRMHLWNAFREGLRDLGYVEGQNIVFELRAPEREGDPFDGLTAELVRLKVDLIVAAGADAVVQSAQRATRTIPIVMISGQDPVGYGLVASLARPGGNVTGLSNISVDLAPKRLSLLKEMVPRLARVAILWNPSSGASKFQDFEAAARTLKLQLLSQEARSAEDVERAFEAITRDRADGLIMGASPLFFGLRTRIAALALKHRLPAIYGAREYAEAGLLLSYGPNVTEGYRRAGTYVDKILKGAKPADLPIEEPTKFDLIINLKTAKALGLKVPPSLLGRADQVIDP